MESRRIGETELDASVLGFGTWALGLTEYGPVDIKAASKAVNLAIDAGINLIDTAEGYGPFHAERILAEALGDRRREIILVTKVGFRFDAENRIRGCDSTRDNVIRRTEGCLERLKTDTIDLLLIHWPDPACPLEETMAALESLVEAGKIRYYGVSNFTVEMMEACERHGRPAANQVGYHLFDRRMESAVLPYCRERGIGFMAYGALGHGLLTGALRPDTGFADSDWRRRPRAFGLPLFQTDYFARELKVVERLRQLAAQSGHTVAQLAIAWVLGHPAVSTALVGVRNEEELQENIRATDWRLTAADRREIDLIFAEEGVPTWSDTPQAVSPSSQNPFRI